MMFFTAHTFLGLLYCVFLTWHFNGFCVPGLDGRGDDISPEELGRLVRVDSQLHLFRSPGDLVAFLAEPGQHSRPMHLLVAAHLKQAGFFDDQMGLRHVFSRTELCGALARHLLPGLVGVGAYPLLLAGLAPYTLLQAPLAAADGHDQGQLQGESPPVLPFGYNTVVLMRFRSRREFVQWLVDTAAEAQAGDLSTGVGGPAVLSALQSLVAGEEGDRHNVKAAGQTVAVPLTTDWSRVLDALVAGVLVPACLLSGWAVTALLICLLLGLADTVHSLHLQCMKSRSLI
mmetsp:Transcript_9122/g.17080  ORF Transcript_9122/g.17080 Transcript_9122/m.17080 type:complete len:287 (+) Transcript_9122:162-1022(+)